jgi:hypothetical protein
MPVDYDNTINETEIFNPLKMRSHFASCIFAESFRKKKK